MYDCVSTFLATIRIKNLWRPSIFFNLIVWEVLWRRRRRKKEAWRNMHGSGGDSGVPVRTDVPQVVVWPIVVVMETHCRTTKTKCRFHYELKGLNNTIYYNQRRGKLMIRLKFNYCWVTPLKLGHTCKSYFIMFFCKRSQWDVLSKSLVPQEEH